MRLRDCILLGSAKLRLRRRRTVVSCVVVGLLFGVIVLVLTLSGAFFGSMHGMADRVFDGKMYVEVGTNSRLSEERRVRERAMELYEESEDPEKQSPILDLKSLYPMMDEDNEFAKIALQEAYESRKDVVREKLEEEAANYGGTVVAELGQKYGLKEGWLSSEVNYEDAVPGWEMEVLDDGIVEPFLLGVEKREDAVAVVITDEIGEKLLGMRGLLSSASSKERYDRFVEIRERVRGMIFTNKVMEGGGEVVDPNDPESELTEPVEIGEMNFYVVGIMPKGGSLMGSPRRFEQNIFTAFFEVLSTRRFTQSIMPSGYVNDYFLENYEKNALSIAHMVEFESKVGAARFIEDSGCKEMGYGCRNGRSMQEFVTNRADMWYTEEVINRWVAVGSLFFGVIALVMMMGVLMRIIGEERQATAIFRATGASKWDIRKIYFAYAVMLTGIMALAAVAIGVTAALVLHIIYGGELTLGARAMYGLAEGGVWLVGLDWRVLLLVLAIVVIGVLCTLALSDRIVTKSIVNDLKE